MKVYDLIKELLVNHPQLRNSDRKLIWSVWYKLGYATSESMTKDAFMNPKCPTTETIRRTRQKVQEEHPELDADETTKKAREAIEKEKGTFVYREEVERPNLMNGHFEKRNGVEIWVLDK